MSLPSKTTLPVLFPNQKPTPMLSLNTAPSKYKYKGRTSRTLLCVGKNNSYGISGSNACRVVSYAKLGRIGYLRALCTIVKLYYYKVNNHLAIFADV